VQILCFGEKRRRKNSALNARIGLNMGTLQAAESPRNTALASAEKRHTSSAQNKRLAGVVNLHIITVKKQIAGGMRVVCGGYAGSVR